MKLGAAEKENDLWLDIRPGREGLDTVEFRAADISPDVHANVSIAIFLQGLEFIARTRPWSLPDMPDAYARNLIEQSARFSAKSGFDAQVFDPFRKSARNLREFSLELLELAAPGINACGNGPWISRIERLFTRQPAHQKDTRELAHSGV
jgi:gamma-glutamyl:cysteine ligase YbdK (ATP-grasp superfamily)